MQAHHPRPGSVDRRHRLGRRIHTIAIAALAVLLTACLFEEADPGTLEDDDIGEVEQVIAICGNGVCEYDPYFPEYGGNCPLDCCDQYTGCWETKGGNGVYYCRSMNGGSYNWISVAQAAPYCDDPSDICNQTTMCGGRSFRCMDIPGVWVENGTCGPAGCATDQYRTCNAPCSGRCAFTGSYWSGYVLGGSACTHTGITEHQGKLSAMYDADNSCQAAFGRPCCCFQYRRMRLTTTDCERWWAWGRRPL